MEIKKAVVIGAGVMGAGIAAQLANAGIEVELLDRVATDDDNRNLYADTAVAKMKKTKPAPFMHIRNSKKIRTGNTEDHMDRIADADIIIEAVFENPKVKHDIFKKIDEHKKAGAVVASNTSTIPLKDLVEGQSDEFKKDFMITHFFNPPRYMQLLEIITSDDTSKEAIETVTQFMEEKMGKGVINCNDTAGFIANRVGTFWLQSAINEAIDNNIGVEEADAIIGRPMGVPKTGVFGLIDMVGLDLMPHISASLLDKLPADDGYSKIFKNYDVVDKMIADGYTGRKGKGGFYRLNTEGGKKVKEVINLKTGEYSVAKRPSPKAVEVSKKIAIKKKDKTKALRALMEHKSPEGQYGWEVMKETIKYAATHVPEIAADIVSVDDAMKLGYNWKEGPFELVDKMGVDWFVDKLEAEGEQVPTLLKTAQEKGSFYRVEDKKKQFLAVDGTYQDIKRSEGVKPLSDYKLQAPAIEKNKSASLWDIEDGILNLEFHSKGNAIDEDIMKMINKAIDIIEDENTPYKGLVIHNEGDHFSIGANLEKALIAVKMFRYGKVDQIVKDGQDTYKRLKYANFPVVGAPSGMALGGGCEVLLHCDAVQAHSELYMGLVELGVGLIPAWGGCAELLTRATDNPKLPKGPMPAVISVFETVGMAKVSTSADEAKSFMFLRPTDGISMNKQHLLSDAKAKTLDMLKNDYTPEEPKNLRLPGRAGHTTLNMAIDGFYSSGLSTPYDVVLADQLAEVLSGGDDSDITVEVTQDKIREMERSNFMKLIKEKRTFNRIMHMLKTGKPLREGADEQGRTTHQLRVDMRNTDGIFTKSIGSLFGMTAAQKKEAANKNSPTCQAASKKQQGKYNK